MSAAAAAANLERMGQLTNQLEILAAADAELDTLDRTTNIRVPSMHRRRLMSSHGHRPEDDNNSESQEPEYAQYHRKKIVRRRPRHLVVDEEDEEARVKTPPPRHEYIRQVLVRTGRDVGVRARLPRVTCAGHMRWLVAPIRVACVLPRNAWHVPRRRSSTTTQARWESDLKAEHQREEGEGDHGHHGHHGQHKQHKQHSAAGKAVGRKSSFKNRRGGGHSSSLSGRRAAARHRACARCRACRTREQRGGIGMCGKPLVSLLRGLRRSIPV